MKGITTYLTFEGSCEEAMRFYAETFNGYIESMQRFRDSSMSIDESMKDRILHASIRAGDLVLMASDTLDGAVQKGTNVSLSLGFESEEEQTLIFNRLSQEGTITMPLQDTFWKSRFGMLTDKYGIHWMFSLNK